MTPEEVKAAVKAEGALTVGNWTYAATDELVKQFQAYVKTTYDADIKLTYAGTQSPSEYITKLAAAKKANSPAPYDVIAVEENYWYDANQQGLVDDALPSGLIPNQSLVLDSFKHAPQSIAFQSTAYPGVVYNKTKASFVKSLMDLANPQLKGKVTIPAPGDITAGGFLLGVAAELGKDYKDPNQMKEVVDWVVANILPNVAQVTTDQPTLQQLFESGKADVVTFWNSLARLEYLGGHTDAALLVPKTIYPANGYEWIPKGAAHPVLAQIFMNWRLAPDVQFPNALADRPRQVERAVRGLPRAKLRQPRPRLVQGRLQHLLPDPRPDPELLQEHRLEGLQRQREGLPGLLQAEARPVSPQLAGAPSSTIRAGRGHHVRDGCRS